MNKRLTDKELDEWKEALAKSNIVYETDDEYREALSNLVGFFDVLIQMDLQQKAENNPDNASLEER